MRQAKARQAQILGQKSQNHSPDVNQLTSVNPPLAENMDAASDCHLASLSVYVGLEDRASQNGCFPEQTGCICRLLAISQIPHPLEYQIT